MKRRSFLAASSALVFAPKVLARNTSWPSREIRMIHPYTAGDQTDINARLIAEGMSEYLKVPVIIDNRPGAGGTLAVKAVGAAQPDGHTINYFTNGSVSLDAIFDRYDLLDEIDPIIRFVDSAQTLLAPNSKNFKSAAHLIEEIQKNPGKLSLGVGGLGTPSHVMWELLSSEFSPALEVNLVPFKSSAELTQAMLGGHLDAGASFLTGVVPFVQTPGRIDVLALTASERIPLVPDIPTVTEALGKDFRFMNWAGMCTTKGTPEDVQDKLYEAVRFASQHDRYKKFCEQNGSIINNAMSRQELRADIERTLVIERKLAIEKNINQNGI